MVGVGTVSLIYDTQPMMHCQWGWVIHTLWWVFLLTRRWPYNQWQLVLFMTAMCAEFAFQLYNLDLDGDIRYYVKIGVGIIIGVLWLASLMAITGRV
jgi:hypothetical protein